MQVHCAASAIHSADHGVNHCANDQAMDLHANKLIFLLLLPLLCL